MPSIYFIPGFDPVGPYRYITILRDALRNLGPSRSIHVTACPTRVSPTDAQCSWNSYIIAQRTSDQVPWVDISIANYTSVIRRQWDHRPLRLIYDSFILLVEFMSGGFLYCFYKDRRVAFLIALQLCTLQAAWLIPLLIIGGFYVSLNALTTNAAAVVIVLLAGWISLVWYAWSIMVHFKIDWLFKALQFQRRLSQPTDNSLNAAAVDLADQLSAKESQHDSNKIYLVSHSSGFSLLLLVLLTLRENHFISILDRIIIVTYGRSLPLNLSKNRLHTALCILLASPKTQWFDITSREDFLCDALLSPNQYVGGEQLPQCKVVMFDYSFSNSAGPANKATRFFWVLFNQFDIHFKYLTKSEALLPSEENPYSSMPRLIWSLIE